MSGTEWVAPGKGDTLGRIREAFGKPRRPGDGDLVTNLLLVEGALTEKDHARYAQLEADLARAIPPQPAPDPGLELVDRLRVVELKPGDVVVLKHPRILSPFARQRLRDDVAGVFRARGIDVVVVVLEEGMDLGVLRPEGHEPCACGKSHADPSREEGR